MAINYFIKGNTATYDRGGYHDIANPLKDYHTYVIDWTKDAVTWSVDGSVIRTIPKDNAQGFPQSPMAIYAGIWAGGDPSNQPGTIDWAGGITDYSQAPFTMGIKSVLVADYSSGKQYSYSDQSGSWESIKADGGKVNGRYDQAQDDIKKLESGQSVDSMIVHPVHPPLLQIHQAHLPHHPVLHPAHLHLPLHHHHHHLPPPLQALLHPAKNPMQFQVLL